MGVQSARFESAGKSSEHLVPGVYSRRATIAGETGVSANNLCIIGYSVGGKPKTLYEFSDKSEAQLVLQNGQLLEAVANAFNGSSDYVPQKVYAMRVNAGTQSALELKSGVNTILKLKSANYGTWCNQIKFWLKDGSVAGTKKVLISFKGDDIVIDNIGKKLMTLMYIGGGERANATVTDTGMKLWATDANGETVDDFSYEWEEIETLYELIDIINSTGVYTATALVNEAETPSGLLDCANFELGESASEDELIKIADITQVPAGQALAVDREEFSRKVNVDKAKIKDVLLWTVYTNVIEHKNIANANTVYDFSKID